MPDSIHHQTTQQMIAEIEKKDRRFRVAQSIFMALLILGFVAGGFLGARAYQTEQENRDRANQAVIAAVNEKLDQQSKQLLCIAKFFTQSSEDRDESRIQSVDECVLENTETGEQSSAPSGESSFLAPGGESPPQTINPNSPGLAPMSPSPKPTPKPDPEPNLFERIINAVRDIIGS